MKHYFTKKIRWILIVSVLLAVLLAVLSNLTGLTLPQMFVQGVLTRLGSGAAGGRIRLRYRTRHSRRTSQPLRTCD